MYPVEAYKFNCEVEKIYGATFVPFIEIVKPVSVFIAKSSDVKVKMPKKLWVHSKFILLRLVQQKQYTQLIKNEPVEEGVYIIVAPEND